MSDVVGRLSRLPQNKWWIHEKVVCRDLNLIASDSISVRTQLSNMHSAIVKGYFGSKETGTSTGFGPMDLSDTIVPNQLNVHFMFQGKKESFPAERLNANTTVKYSPRYYHFGTLDKLSSGPSVKVQCNVLRCVMGEAGGGLDDTTMKRRAAKWTAWYTKDTAKGSRSFEKNDISDIALKFRDVWDVNIPNSITKPQNITPQMLTAVGKEIRELLAVSNCIKKSTRSHATLLDSRTPPRPLPEMPSARRQKVNVPPELPVPPAPITAPIIRAPVIKRVPMPLLLTSLRTLVENDDVDELAALEYSVVCLDKNNNLSAADLSQQFQSASIQEPHSITLGELSKLNSLQRGVAKKHIEAVRAEMLGKLPGGGLFQPQDTDLLVDWISSGRRYSKGDRLPAENYEMHPHSHRLWLKDRSAHFLRHISACFGVPLARIPSLWQCFAVLLLGRPLEQDEFSSSETIQIRCQLVSATDVNIGNGWGTYHYDQPKDRPDKEKQFFDLLVQDGESVAHFFQQLGLMRDCARVELQTLSKETTTKRKGGILEFKISFPVIFAALHAAFGMMPSNTRLAEQNMGGLRHGLKDGVSLQRTDAERAYLNNIEYAARHERRELVRTRQKEHDERCGKETKATKGSIKHDKQKPEQQMVGEQLLASGTKYDKSEVEKLPANIQKEASLTKVKKKGFLHKDKTLEEKNAQRDAEKHAKRRAVPLTMEQWKTKAQGTQVGNDAGWQNPETTQRLKIFETLCTQSYWSKVKVADGFFEQAKNVLPGFWKESMSKTKGEVMKALVAHVALIRKIADKTVPNSITTIDLSRLDRVDILAEFIKVDKATSLSKAETAVQMRKKATAALLASCGNEMDNYYVVEADEVELDDDDDDDDSGE
jgi:hypothetical protein